MDRSCCDVPHRRAEGHQLKSPLGASDEFARNCLRTAAMSDVTKMLLSLSIEDGDPNPADELLSLLYDDSEN